MLVEKKTRMWSCDEDKGSNIEVRDTTHIVDDQTGERKGSTHHRFVCECDDDVTAAKEGLTDIANLVWTQESRKQAKDKKLKDKDNPTIQ